MNKKQILDGPCSSREAAAAGGNMRTILAVICAFMPSLAWAGFDLDMGDAEFRHATKYLTIADLAVGEKGIVLYPSLCNQDGLLMVYSRAALADQRSSYDVSWIATRISGGELSFTLEGTPDGKHSIRETLIRALNNAVGVPCRATVFASGALVPVSDINGVSSLTEALQFQDPKP